MGRNQKEALALLKRMRAVSSSTLAGVLGTSTTNAKKVLERLVDIGLAVRAPHVWSTYLCPSFARESVGRSQREALALLECARAVSADGLAEVLGITTSEARGVLCGLADAGLAMRAPHAKGTYLHPTLAQELGAA